MPVTKSFKLVELIRHMSYDMILQTMSIKTEKKDSGQKQEERCNYYTATTRSRT